MEIEGLAFWLIFISSFISMDGHLHLECKLTSGGHEYLGTQRVTRSGKTCQRWDSNEPHAPSAEFTDPNNFPDYNLTMAENFCRNPDRGWHQSPWCYTIVHRTRWENCDTPFCECKTDRVGSIYQGKRNRTVSGLTCQSWNSQTPHAHNFTQPQMFADRTFAARRNNCRNPDNFRPDGPWCFTTNSSVRWEYCSIPDCCELRQDCPTTAAPPMTTTELEIMTTTTPPDIVDTTTTEAPDIVDTTTTAPPDIVVTTTPEFTTQTEPSAEITQDLTPSERPPTKVRITAATETSKVTEIPVTRSTESGKISSSNAVKIILGVGGALIAVIGTTAAIFWWRRYYVTPKIATAAKKAGSTFDNVAFEQTS